MWDQLDPARVFAAALILGVLLLYFVLVQLRRGKYRGIADDLQATYVSQGPFRSGEIAGSNYGREYSIQSRASQKTLWTTFTMSCVNRGIVLYLGGRFFKDFPNWRFAYTTGDRSERVFVARIMISGGFVPLEEKYHAQVQNIFREIAPDGREWLGKWRNRLEIKKDAISFTMHGLLNNAEGARQVLSFLANAAGRVEASPVNP